MLTFERMTKGLVKEILWRPPRAVRSGARSYIYRPRRIDGPQFIRMGARSTVDRHGWLSAVTSYAGIEYCPQIILGDDVHIGRYVCLTAISGIIIEDGCLFSEHVYVSDHTHGMDPQEGLIVNQPLISKGPVHIGADSFVGYHACILPGVTLGKHCVVGANSVVTHSFPDFSVVAGSPARLIKLNLPAALRKGSEAQTAIIDNP
jgi:acetyltransferase-like isoleucine patch superfamily enzyme